jgi:PKD repeat protein
MTDILTLKAALRSSLDDDYGMGHISIFPSNTDMEKSIDNQFTLYQATNNAQTVATQALPYNGKYIVVEDASLFPPNGLLRIGPRPGEHKPGEIIHYSSRTNTVFSDLVRGYVQTRQNQWEKGSSVCGSVMAEHHNALKDAVWNIEHYLGLKDLPTENSINGIVKRYETKYLSPKPMFRAFPLYGVPPLNVRFQNFSNTDAIRFLWDFGDGTQSIERNPNHIYYDQKTYTVKLHIITSSGAQGISKKNSYINVNKQEASPFFYTVPQGDRTFLFVDQTEGDIAQRYWVFDDDTQAVLVADPNEHTIIHQYQSAGTYGPSILIVYGDQRIKRYYSNILMVE